MLKSCPICKGIDITDLVQIKDFPILSNVQWPSRAEAINAPLGEIQLTFCKDCGHIFNRAFDPEKLKYTQGYENSLHFSPRFNEYATSLAAGLVERYRLRGKDIIEIGSGQGDFLAMLCQMGGNRGVGFDPSYAGNGGGDAGQITFYRAYYDEDYGHLPVDFLVSRHVFEHIPAPDEFLAMLRRVIGAREEVVVFFEVPNVHYTLYREGIWDILYEHISYFSPYSLARVFRQNDFRVCRQAETFGEQFLTIEAAPCQQCPDSTEDAEGLEQLEEAAETFAGVYRNKVELWKGQLERLASSGQRAVIWGAGTKGISFLNTLKNQEAIEYVVDINPRKKGMFISGTGQEIVPPEFLQTYQPEAVIVMNANYEKEIKARLQDLGIAPKLYLA